MSDIEFEPNKLDRSKPTYIAGHRGLVGSAIWRLFKKQGFEALVGRTSSQLDLTERTSVFRFFQEVRPEVVVVAAAKVGGILANSNNPAGFLSTNLQIQTNVLDAALEYQVPRLLFLGSSCIYPKFARQPIREDALLTGVLEPTNEAYAIAKIAGILQVQAVRRQHGLRWISAMPTNLYGPGDNFSETGSHLLPALIRRYTRAIELGHTKVTNWGSGNPRRELLHVDDLASACLTILEKYDADSHINVGTGVDLAIKEIAEMVGTAVGFTGETLWDSTKPDGTPRKVLDISALRALGWESEISLQRGIAATVRWYRQNLESVRM